MQQKWESQQAIQSLSSIPLLANHPFFPTHPTPNSASSSLQQQIDQQINHYHMKILLLSFLLAVSLADVCTQPQRIFYMSYPALGKRDAIGNLFLELDTKLTPISNNYTDTNLQANFKIPSLLPQSYYNDHHQNEAYLDKLKINVTLGDIAIGMSFNYTVDYSSKVKTGKIFARGRLDPSFFTKNLTMTEGYLEWAPDVVPPFTFTQFLTIESSQPKLTEPQLDIFTKMLNNQAGPRRIKQETVQQINNLYGGLLKQHLNHEELISTNNITYKYRNITLNIQNFAKDFYLSNGNTNGLQAFFIYGLSSSKENCTVLGKEFDEDEYGGFQEIISFGIVRSMIKEALSQGLYDVTLDKTWQTPGFQLFMGDLGNSVPYANYAPAGDRFNATCNYDPSRAQGELKIARYEDKQIYVSVPENCTVSYQGKPILGIKMDVNFVVEILAAENSIKAIVRSTGIFGSSFTSLDQNYRVQSPVLAQHSITEILNGLVGKQLFGSNFPSLYRRYPVVRVLDDRIVIFDPSER